MTINQAIADVSTEAIVFALLDEIHKGEVRKKILISPLVFENLTITISLPTQQTNPQGTFVRGYFPSDLRKYFGELDITEPQNDLAHVIARNILAEITVPTEESDELRISQNKIPNESRFLALIEKAKKLASSVEAVMGPAGG